MMTRAFAQMRSASGARRALGIAFLAGLASTLILVAVWFPVIRGYYPSNDELAIEASAMAGGAAVHPQDWFTRGFHGLFEPYPEWGSPNTDYLRPLAQALFWFHYQVWGDAWSSQIVLGFLCHGMVVMLVAYLALTLFRLPPTIAAVAIGVGALNPALWISNASPRFPIAYLIQFPIFQTEIVCALLMLLAYLAFVRGRFAWFGVVSLLALFLKENALTLPFTALILVGAWRGTTRRQTVVNLAWILGPLVIWLAFKLVLLAHVAADEQGVAAAVPGPSLHELLRNAAYWPTGAFDMSLRSLAEDWKQQLWYECGVHGAQLLFNLAWWLAIAAAAAHAARRIGRRWWEVAPEPWVSALVFSFGNLALFLAMDDAQLRHGYFWFALGTAALLSYVAGLCRATVVASVLGLGLVLPLLPSIVQQRSEESLGNFDLVKHASRDFIRTLSALPGEVDTVYVIDDVFVQPAGPDALRDLSGFRGRVVLVNSLDRIAGCHAPADAPRPARTIVRESDGVALHYDAPPACFRWAWMVAPESQLRAGQRIQRGQTMRYDFPELRASPTGVLGDHMAYDVGQRWDFMVSLPGCPSDQRCRWFALNPHEQRYEEVHVDASSAGVLPPAIRYR